MHLTSNGYKQGGKQILCMGNVGDWEFIYFHIGISSVTRKVIWGGFFFMGKVKDWLKFGEYKVHSLR